MSPRIECGRSVLGEALKASVTVALRGADGRTVGFVTPKGYLTPEGKIITDDKADIWVTLIEQGRFFVEPKTLIGQLFVSTLITAGS